MHHWYLGGHKLTFLFRLAPRTLSLVRPGPAFALPCLASCPQSQPPPPPSAPHSLFYSLHPQAFPLPFYISRLVTHLPTPPSTYITALILLDRLQAAHPGTLAVTSLNVHRLLITALLIAAKTLHEPALPNALAAAVGGVGLAELRRLELAMLSRLRWAVFVRADEYFVYERALMSRVERGGGPTPAGSPVLSHEW